MNPFWKENNSTIYEGDCLDVMAELPADSIDTILTDPPYGLEFMGNDWDRGVPGVAFWTAALRVAKPGAFLLSFGGTRTFHRLTCAIEDAGWEIRDCLMWLYGSGFPKSLDISKSIDRQDEERKPEREKIGRWLRARREAAGLKQKGVATHWPSATGGLTGCVANWELGFNCPTWDQWVKLKEVIGFGDEMDAEVWRLNGRKGKPGKDWDEREVIAQHTEKRPINSKIPLPRMGAPREPITWDITKAASENAKTWEGWGTALKPAWEPIILAMKPTDGTFAENALEHGVAGLNIDGARVEGAPARVTGRGWDGAKIYRGTNKTGTVKEFSQPDGRWPANVIHDGSDEVVDLFPDTGISRGGSRRAGGQHGRYSPLNAQPDIKPGFGDAGSAARFFYCSKASSADRGNVKYSALPLFGEEESEEINEHPTVKPTELMVYLCRLTKTPTGGVILDPFMGSGTTLVAAKQEGRECVGIDIERKYCELAKRRVERTPQEAPR